MTKKLLVITGPTATGKTALGVDMALFLNGEVVSADSMQIYKGMDIGTAKVTKEETRGVFHHMTDIVSPFENFSVSRYVSQADKAVSDILSREKLPIIVGGTGLYIDSLLKGTDFDDGAFDESLRQGLSLKYDSLGGEHMQKMLSSFDPDRAKKLHPADKKRILRAIEFYTLTGKTITEHDERTKKLPPKYDCVKIALSFEDRQELYQRIDSRVDKMVSAGLFDEVRALLDSGLSPDSTAMQAIGYRQAASFLSGQITMDEAIDEIKRESRRYAKRQLTWLRRDMTVRWVLFGKCCDFARARQLSTEYYMEQAVE